MLLGVAEAVQQVDVKINELGFVDPVLPVFAGGGQHRCLHYHKPRFLFQPGDDLLVFQYDEVFPETTGFPEKSRTGKQALIPEPEWGPGKTGKPVVGLQELLRIVKAEGKERASVSALDRG